MDCGCSAGQIVGAVLGTFFGTLLLCVVISVVIYRWRLSHLHERQADIEKKRVPDSQTTTYVNGGFHDSETYESQPTLPLRHPEPAQLSSTVVLKNEAPRDETSSKADQATEYSQERIIQLALSHPDVIDFGFEVRDDVENGVSRGIVVSQVLPQASDWLRTVMLPGDELVSITIDITSSLSIAQVRAVLQQTLASSVRLTLCRRSRPSSSSPAPTAAQLVHDHQTGHNISTVDDEQTAASRRSSVSGNDVATFDFITDEQQPSARLTFLLESMASILQSESPTATTFLGANNDDAAGEQLPVRTRLANGVREDVAQIVTPVMTSVSDVFESATSDNVANVDGDVVVSSGGNPVGNDSVSDVGSLDSLDYVNLAETMPTVYHQMSGVDDGGLGSPEETADADSYVHVDRLDFGSSNDGLDRALAFGQLAPNRSGLDRALRAKERATPGGMAYYVDLEPHFNGISDDFDEQQ